MKSIFLTATQFGLMMTGLPAAHAQSGVSPDRPFSFDAAPGRLPKNVVPIDYVLAITPDPDRHSVDGTETITLLFREKTAIIEFNSLNQVLSDVLFDGKPVSDIATSNEKQLTTLTLDHPGSAGRHTLQFRYKGVLESRPFGLFSQSYVKPDGSRDQIISSKFEATDARRMFPCWDEPAFRATFELTATVQSGWATVSNMPVKKRLVRGSLSTTTFARTPKMPTYLLEFTAGNLAALSAKVGKTQVSIWAVRGQEQDGAIALANTRQILADYNDYFGYAYPLPKLDSIATPGGFSGAMENWGAITYNDQRLLVTASSTLSRRQGIYSIQAHEMAHQWNGDLVTMGWWDDLWLNESFASWRSARQTDLRNPTWKWAEQQDESRDSVMNADARLNSHPIRQHVTNELEARSAFDDITYKKGQAVLNMFEAYLGPDVFRAGVRKFIKAHAYSNATSADLWNALAQVSHQDVDAIISDWTTKTGFPLVGAAASCDGSNRRTVTLTQKRFLLQGFDQSGSQWKIPLQVRVGSEAVPTSVLFVANGQQIPAGMCGQALSLNADMTGYYRVAYDRNTFLSNVEHFRELPFGDRIALLDDQWALAESDARYLPDYLALVQAMGVDFDERAWNQITRALAIIEFDERDTPGHDAYIAYARSLIKPLANLLGWDAGAAETPGVQQLRRTVQTDLGAWGDREVIASARDRYALFVADHTSISPDDQAMILSIIAKNADQVTFDQLHALARSAKNETELRRYYLAMMQVDDPELAKQAGTIALSPEIPDQAASVRFQMLGTLSDANPAIAWTALTQNVELVMAAYPQYVNVMLSKNVPEMFWSAVAPDELETWIKTRVPGSMFPNVARGMEMARFRRVEKESLVTAVDAYIAGLKTDGR